MIKDIFEKLERRRATVEKLDFDIQRKNEDQFRVFWLHITILSSALIVGILPIIASGNGLIKSFFLAKLGLLVIILLCVLVVIYFQNVLIRGKLLLFDQIKCHQDNFYSQRKILVKQKKREKQRNKLR